MAKKASKARAAGSSAAARTGKSSSTGKTSKKTTARAPAAKKTTTRKTAKKAAAKKTPAKKAAARKTAPKKTTTKKAVAKKTTVRAVASSKKTTTKKTAARRATPAASATSKKAPAKKVTRKKVLAKAPDVSKKTPTTTKKKTAARTATTPAATGSSRASTRAPARRAPQTGTRGGDGAAAKSRGLFGGRRKEKAAARRAVICYFCGHRHEVSTKTMSTTCPGCNRAIKIEDVVVKTYLPVADLQTCGKITITKRGRVAAGRIQSGQGIVCEGTMEGNVEAEGGVKLGPKARWKGKRLQSGGLIISPGAVMQGDVCVPWTREEAPAPQLAGVSRR
ncbi:MAG: polymer-forming cytoskeletal protein [Planctomycetota bacterium]|jgi:hypothetical protein